MQTARRCFQRDNARRLVPCFASHARAPRSVLNVRLLQNVIASHVPSFCANTPAALDSLLLKSSKMFPFSVLMS